MGRRAAVGRRFGTWNVALTLAFALGCGGQTRKTDGGTDTSTWTNTITSTGMGTGVGTGMGTGVVTSTADGTDTGATYTGAVTTTGVGSRYPLCNPIGLLGADSVADASARVFSGVELEARSLTLPVTVQEVCQDGDQPMETCMAPTAGDAQRLPIAGPNLTSLELRVAHPKLSADFFQAGETLELDLFAWPYTNFFGTVTCQDVQLSRSGVTVLIAHSCPAPSQSASAPSPDKGVPAGVTVGELAVTDAGVGCAVANGGFCDYWYHSAKVELAGAEATVQPGETKAVGNYAFTLARYRDAVDTGNCDSSSEVQFVAIRN